MKVDLSLRDIEMILNLINDSVCEEVSVERPLVFTVEELSLIEKLEGALKRGELSDNELLEAVTGDVYH